MPRLGQEEQDKWKKDLNAQLESFFIPESEKQQKQETTAMYTILEEKNMEGFRNIMPDMNVLLTDWRKTERKAGNADAGMRTHLAEMYTTLGIDREVPEQLTVEEFRDTVQLIWLSLKGYTSALAAGCPDEISAYRDYYEQVFLESDYQRVMDSHKAKKEDDYFLDEDGDRNFYEEAELNEAYRKKQLPVSEKRLAETLELRSNYIIPMGAPVQAHELQKLLDTYNHEFGLALRQPMEAVMNAYNSVVADSSAYTPAMYRELKKNFVSLTGLSEEKAEERFPGEGTEDDFLVGAHELWAFFNAFTEEHKDNKSYYFGSRGKYYEEVFQPGFKTVREELQKEQNPPEAAAIREKLADYLIPADPAAQNTILDGMPEVLEKLYVYNPAGFIDKTKKLLEEYNRVAGADAGQEDFQDAEHGKLYNNLYRQYYELQLEAPGAKGPEDQFPKETRSREDYLKNVQKFWVYLRTVTEKAATEEVELVTFLEKIFDKVKFDKYYKELQKKAPQAGDKALDNAENNAPKQEAVNPAGNNAPAQEAMNPAENPEEQKKAAQKKKLLENLIPDQPQKQQEDLEYIRQAVGEQVYFTGANGLNNSMQECLKDYNRLLNGEVPRRKELDEMYQNLFTLSMGLNLTQQRVWTDEYPEFKRSPENYMMNLQRVWVFLKDYTEACSQDKEYLKNPVYYIRSVFNDLNFNEVYQQAVADEILDKVEKQPKAPLQLRDKLKLVSESLPEFLDGIRQSVEQSRETYNNMRGVAGLDPKVQEPQQIKENLGKLNDFFTESIEQKKQLEAKAKSLKTLRENKKKFVMMGIFNGGQDKTVEALLQQIEKQKQDWNVTVMEAVMQKRNIQGIELEDAFVSFEAAAAAKLKVSSGHAEEFGRIKEAIAAYRKNDSTNVAAEKKCAEDLYRACREYLNAHTGDGYAQEEIGGQGTDTGRLRKQAVVKLLEVMEKKAQRQPEFEAAKESYKAYYEQKHNDRKCPELELSALKASLARNSRAEVRANYDRQNDWIAVSGVGLTDKKAYAELETARTSYLRKKQAREKEQGARAARQRANRQPRA